MELLKIKHTNDFSSEYFNEHPHKYNLFGLSKMLSDYGVENAGTRIEDKENDRKNTQLQATPTILVNGHKLPDNYKIEDLKYFTEFVPSLRTARNKAGSNPENYEFNVNVR